MKLFYGLDVLEGLSNLEDKFVHCCITSPPYWGLRDYREPGQIGLEETPDLYVEKMVTIFKEVHRVLRDDGTLWLNLGDSYVGSGHGRNQDGSVGIINSQKQQSNLGSIFSKSKRQPRKSRDSAWPENGRWGGGNNPATGILKPKDLAGIPWRVALALQKDGWYLRSDIIWSKPNPMPESVKDRPTRSHEYIFLLTKSKKYFYDADAIREPCKNPKDDKRRYSQARPELKSFLQASRNGIRGKAWNNHENDLVLGKRILQKTNHPLGRNKRTVWEIPTEPYSEAHFATFPTKLVLPMVKSGCPKGGIVLDPFSGSGTTGAVAIGCGRNYIGIDLNKNYEKLAMERIGGLFLGK